MIMWVAGGLRNQMAAQRQFLLTCTIGEQAVVADADEAIGQDVLQKATEKLHGIEFHHAVACGHRHSPGNESSQSPNWQP